MKAVDRHPPTDRRCQIYMGDPNLYRCRNLGTHWESWGSHTSGDLGDEVSESDFFSWECDGDHDSLEAFAC